MRTTIRLDEHLLKEAKQLALRRGKSLTSIIEDALRESLARQRGSEPRTLVHLPTFKGQGLLPGVDLDDSAALLDLMDSAARSTDDPD
jgi:hypothetical protein